MIRIGIVGIGSIAESYISLFSKEKFEGAEITALTSRNQLKLNSIIDNYRLKGIKIFEKLEDMLAYGNVDAVIICTPHHLHAEMIEMVLKSGKHVLTDKPLGIKTSEVNNLVSLSMAHPELKAGVIFNRRSTEIYKKVKELVESGKIGELRRAVWQTTNLYRTYDYYTSNLWRGSFKTEGGGVLINQAIHQLDTMLWIIGMPVKVSAHTTEGFHRPIFTENDISIHMVFNTGATADFMASTHEFPGTNRFELSYDMGQIIIEDDAKITIRLLEEKEEDFAKRELGQSGKIPYVEYKEVIHAVPNGEQQERLIRNFILAIQGKEELICPFKEGQNSVKMINAAYLSAWKDKTVSLDFDPKEYDEALALKK
ncbi:MAG: Gfo/Idh/MocA family oxidoreductase [Clostridiaceae bacterium]